MPSPWLLYVPTYARIVWPAADAGIHGADAAVAVSAVTPFSKLRRESRPIAPSGYRTLFKAIVSALARASRSERGGIRRRSRQDFCSTEIMTCSGNAIIPAQRPQVTGAWECFSLVLTSHGGALDSGRLDRGVTLADNFGCSTARVNG